MIREIKAVLIGKGGSLIKALFYRDKSPKEVFETIYRHNLWRSKESVSGPGSSVKETEVLIKQLPTFLKRYKIKSMLDIPCGDFNWMKVVDLSTINTYIGADIVKKLSEENNQKYKSNTFSFCCLNLIEDTLPKVDLVFVRDCLVHLSEKDIKKVFENLKKSKSTYLMTTNYPLIQKNWDIETGSWRPINLRLKPFNLANEIDSIKEGRPEINGANCDKSMTLWKIRDLGF